LIFKFPKQNDKDCIKATDKPKIKQIINWMISHELSQIKTLNKKISPIRGFNAIPVVIAEKT